MFDWGETGLFTPSLAHLQKKNCVDTARSHFLQIGCYLIDGDGEKMGSSSARLRINTDCQKIKVKRSPNDKLVYFAAFKLNFLL